MNEFRRIANTIRKAGGMCLEVGGSVRDRMLGLECKDRDVEVYQLSQDSLEAILRRFGKVNIVGESFGVIKLKTSEQEYDFSLPRTDNKIGKGHKGFNVIPDASLTPKEAAARRDYTINSMGIDVFTGALFDYYNGQQDIEKRLLRATSEQFAEDPLRVLRGFQFAARFDMEIEENTAQMAWSVHHTFDELPKERVFGEFWKWATKGVKPSKGLQFLFDSGWIALFPELSGLIELPQDSEHHPEGDVWIHTGFVCDAMANICTRENIVDKDRVVLMLAALCHDLGKFSTTAFTDGKWRSPGHDEASVSLTETFLNAIGCYSSITERVVPLVREHMAHVHLGNNLPTKRVVRRLAMRLGQATIKELLFVMEADHSGRPPKPVGLSLSAQAIGRIADELRLEKAKPQPIVLGRHLIELGMKPGPTFRPILDRLFEMQLDGEFHSLDEGKRLAESLVDG